MERCPICHGCFFNKIKIVKNTQIFECLNCELGFIRWPPIKIAKNIYNFKSYKKRERYFRNIFDPLAVKIRSLKSKGTILDIGTGFGLYSAILLDKGQYKLDCIEPNIYPYYLKNKISHLYTSTFENYRSKNKYDVILLMDVLEHFVNPVKNLEKINKLLAKDGILIIQTPNYKSLMARLCYDWAWWMVEDHKFFFSPKSIKGILENTGFKIKELVTYESTQDFKSNLDGNFTNIKNILIRKISKAIFYSFFFPFYFLSKKLLQSFGYGGLLFVISTKD